MFLVPKQPIVCSWKILLLLVFLDSGISISIQIILQSPKRSLDENHYKYKNQSSSFIIIVPMIFAAVDTKFFTHSTCSTKITKNFIAIPQIFSVPLLEHLSHTGNFLTSPGSTEHLFIVKTNNSLSMVSKQMFKISSLSSIFENPSCIFCKNCNIFLICESLSYCKLLVGHLFTEYWKTRCCSPELVNITKYLWTCILNTNQKISITYAISFFHFPLYTQQYYWRNRVL